MNMFLTKMNQLLPGTKQALAEKNRRLSVMKTAFTPLPLATIALPIVLAGCGSSNSSNNDSLGSSSDSDGSNSGSQPQTITIPFEALANGTAIDCDTPLSGLGTSGSDGTLKDFRFYVHNLRLGTDQGRELTVDLDDNPWQSEGIALVDFQNKGDACSGDAKQTHKQISGSVSLDTGETINHLSFTIGVPSAVNHQDQTLASSPLNITSMFWSWQTGYKFMRLDVAPVGGIIRTSDPTYSNTVWNFHLGSTDCSGDPQLGDTVTCGRRNRPDVSLANFDSQNSKVVVDYGVLVAGANLGLDEGGAPGCMSGAADPECPTIFTALGLDRVSGEVDSTTAQTVFSLQ